MWPAVLAGNKTQTRREGSLKILNEKPNNWKVGLSAFNSATGKISFNFETKSDKSLWLAPHYHPGEIVYLKEPVIDGGPAILPPNRFVYKYDLPVNMVNQPEIKWRNKLFMPKEAARYYVKITNVRVQRLKDTPDEDIIKEGLYFLTPMHNLPAYYIKDNVKIFFSSLKSAYLDLFKKVGKKMPTKNPWLFIYDFELCEKPSI